MTDVKRMLSRGEFEVYTHMLDGITNQEIADRLYVSEKAVKFHITHIFAKLEIKTRYELLVRHYKAEVERVRNESFDAGAKSAKLALLARGA